MPTKPVSHNDVVKALLDAKAIDFTAIGKVFADLGPALAQSDEAYLAFGGTQRGFVQVYILSGPPGAVEDLDKLKSALNIELGSTKNDR